MYLPFLDAFSYASLLRSGGKGLLDAVSISAVALTTLGYGDIVAGTDALRLATVVEAAAGAAVSQIPRARVGSRGHIATAAPGRGRRRLPGARRAGGRPAPGRPATPSRRPAAPGAGAGG